jgi:hypothetical protein
LEKASVEAFTENAPGFANEAAAWKAALSKGDEKIRVGEFGEFAIKDVLAAVQIYELRDYRRAIRHRRKAAATRDKESGAP